MEWVTSLKQKIKNKSIIVGVVGLGYVGLPLAVAFSKKFLKLLVMIRIVKI